MITVKIPPECASSHYYFPGVFKPLQPRLQDGALVLDIEEHHFRSLIAGNPAWGRDNVEIHRRFAAADMMASQAGAR